VCQLPARHLDPSQAVMAQPRSAAEVLAERVADPELRRLYEVLLKTSAQISSFLSTALVTDAGTKNIFGDEQLNVDVIADKAIFDNLRESQLVASAASEEVPELQQLTEGGKFVVCFDPLDGSSIVDCNFAVGSIFGIWPSTCLKGGSMLGSCGRDQVGSCMTVYGSRTTCVLALDDGIYDFSLVGDGRWVIAREKMAIADKAKIFSPANLRAAQDLPAYDAKIREWMSNRLTLRYTGGMVPDIYQCFVKGHGIFANPASETAKAKLRVAFEVAPLAFLVHKAGGDSKTGRGSALDLVLDQMDMRTQVCMGSKLDVEAFPM